MRLTDQDRQMRAEGYVTAGEVAEALGKALSNVHRAIESGRIPGRSVGPETYQRHYVDVHALLAKGDYAGSETITAKLQALAKDVPRPPGATAAPAGGPPPDAVSKLAAQRRGRAPAAARR